MLSANRSVIHSIWNHQITISYESFQLYSSSDSNILGGLIWVLILNIPVWLCFKFYRDELKEEENRKVIL